MLKDKVEKNWPSLKIMLLILLLLGLLLAGFVLGERVAFEQSYKSVELAIDYDALCEESYQTDQPMATLLKSYYDQGATSLFIKERNATDILAQANFHAGRYLQSQGLPVRSDLQYIEVVDTGLADRLEFNLNVRGLFEDRIDLASAIYIGTKMPLHQGWTLSEKNRSDLLSCGLGWPEEDMKLAQELGYFLQVQIKDWKNPDIDLIEEYFEQLLTFQSISLVMFDSPDIFALSEAENKQDVVQMLAQQINKLDVPLGHVEFYEQKGFIGLSQALENRVVRVHTITANELAVMSEGQAVDRFSLAVKDRNMRSLFVRPLVAGPLGSVEENQEYIGHVSQSIENMGFQLGQVGTVAELNLNLWQILVLAMAVLAGVVLLARAIGLAHYGLIGAPLVLVSTFVVLGPGHTLWLQKLYALLAASIFPTLGLVFAIRHQHKEGSILHSMVSVVQASAVALLGGILVAGLLRDRVFMLGLNGFAGVKLAHLIPLFLLVLYGMKDLSAIELKEKGQLLWKQSITIGLFFLLMMVVGVLLVYLLRTGNTGGTVSSVEEIMRRILEKGLGARPRTKEFLIGYPLLMLAFHQGYGRRNFLLFIVGMIAQVSLVNTFAHIHTPLYLGVLRSLYGLIIGVVLGVLLIILVNWCKEKWETLS